MMHYQFHTLLNNEMDEDFVIVVENANTDTSTNTNAIDKDGDDAQRDGVVMGSRHHHTAGAVTKGMWRQRRRLRSYKAT